VVSWQDAQDFDWPIVDSIFSDFDVQGKLMLLWNYFTNHLVLMRATQVKNVPQLHSKVLLTHALCGGVTDGTWWVHVYTNGLEQHLEIPVRAQRDMTMVINSMPVVALIRPGTYHNQGVSIQCGR
jgi:hypothetical protein